MAIMGLPKSPSVMPVARHKARAPAILRPWVEVLERYCGMVGFPLGGGGFLSGCLKEK